MFMVPCSCTRPMRTGRSGSQESLIGLRPANFCRQCLCTLCHSQVCRRAVCRKSHFLPPIATFFKCHFFDLSTEENRGIRCERQDRKRTQVWMVQIRSQPRLRPLAVFGFPDISPETRTHRSAEFSSTMAKFHGPMASSCPFDADVPVKRSVPAA